MRLIQPIVLTFLLSLPVQAVDLGVWGDLYPVVEEDMLSAIHNRLSVMEKSGELAQKQAEFTERVKENSLRPVPVEGISRVQENQTHYFDPTFTVSQDIADHKGTVFAVKGNRINPLESVPFNHTLYFINGDDPEQVEWMKRQEPKTLAFSIVLVNGNIKTATEALSTRIYFDQGGTMTRKFGITAVPARVTAAEGGLQLRVDMIKPEVSQ
ncbi:type-F conjugative transfer system protein TraW [Budviciaceae bacterium BWR-B9]|uniref:Type-F conjugative transfer system protein TraW n=1 Tax=Limnobaculum allomyrinae TaxID=2791986 RepID=A0ABS1IUX5_9GAMM|nr:MULTISPECIES: type-F conjugative transfer system protein TraW [Limnobaculum]MBK5145543.1 type-F conjugative transfer system protein TraW [Limnobaculum allomyrinae]MBV7693662.1 type-F conjugative transfer system protein TraW [Limnobaculum sp. M2-1]